ncbi:MAG: acyltransferase [Sphingomonadales bacterium]|nr:acyltransferase [Sphingomonadales bacterium]
MGITPPYRIHGLDALRGIAALGVFCFHLNVIFPGTAAWSGKGYLAVDFFMMLSGYVMGRTYEARMASGLGITAFVALRHRRLWLTMALGGLIGIPYLWHVTGDPLVFAFAFALNLALLPGSVRHELFPLNNPGWSIFYELVANALHAAFLWRLGHRGLIALIMALLLPMTYFAQLKGDLNFGELTQQAGPALVRCLTSYAIGLLLWRWWRDRPVITIPPVLALIALPTLLLSPWAGLGWGFDLAFVLVASPLLIAGGLGLRANPRWTVWAGAVSFPLYAVHMATFRTAYLAGIGPVPAAIFALAAALTMAWWLPGGLRHARRHRTAAE